MDCKFPKTSRSYKFCVGCNDRYMCENYTFEITPMPNVKPPKNDNNEIEKAIKLLIDNGYSVTKLN